MAFTLKPPPALWNDLRQMTRWCREALQDLDDENTWSGKQVFSLPPVLPTYTVAGVPSAVTYKRGLIYVSNETGGPTLAFSDGTNWRRVQDRAVVS